jgi:polysaccharide biosynthesis/export protein
MLKNCLFAFLAILCFSSCKVFRSNLMLETPKNYQYQKLIDSISRLDYKIAPNDALQCRVFTNDGFKLIDLANSANAIYNTNLEFLVESDGAVKLPLVGPQPIMGLTIREAEKYLEEKYSEFYVKPYVNIKVSNKRVIVFPGNSGDARVIPLTNNNTTVLEAIASAGGITNDGKAYKVKLIRSAPNQPKADVYLMDLSRIDGLVAGNSKVQANDIIYVEPRYRVARTLVGEITPIISLITSFFVIYYLVVRK